MELNIITHLAGERGWGRGNASETQIPGLPSLWPRISENEAKIKPSTKNHHISRAYINVCLGHELVGWLHVRGWAWLDDSAEPAQAQSCLGVSWGLPGENQAPLRQLSSDPSLSYPRPETSMLDWACLLMATARVQRSQLNFTNSLQDSTTSCLFKIQWTKPKPKLTSEGERMFFSWESGGRSEHFEEESNLKTACQETE